MCLLTTTGKKPPRGLEYKHQDVSVQGFQSKSFSGGWRSKNIEKRGKAARRQSGSVATRYYRYFFILNRLDVLSLLFSPRRKTSCRVLIDRVLITSAPASRTCQIRRKRIDDRDDGGG